MVGRYLFSSLRKMVHSIALLIALPILLVNAAHAEPQRLLIFGDSLVAGYGLDQGVAFPDQLAAALRQDGYDLNVINGGISGDTSAGGASRIAWSLSDKPDAVVVVLGGNDALRGLPPQDMERNLTQILTAVQDEGLPVLLAGMHAPANMGMDYGKAFDAAFIAAVDTAKSRKPDVIFYPFFLDGVALVTELNQNDGIHPNENGVGVIVERITPFVKDLLALADK